MRIPENMYMFVAAANLMKNGRRIYLMKALMIEVRFEEGGIVVHMRKSAGQRTAKDAQQSSLE